jgi:hypothetical protein
MAVEPIWPRLRGLATLGGVILALIGIVLVGRFAALLLAAYQGRPVLTG